MLRVAEQYSGSDTGRQRRANEDSLMVRSPLFVVADGMGGAQAGEVASKVAVEAFQAALALKPDLRTVLRQLGETLEVLGRKDEARAIIRRRLELDDRDLGALYQLVRLDPRGVSGEDRARLHLRERELLREGRGERDERHPGPGPAG